VQKKQAQNRKTHAFIITRQVKERAHPLQENNPSEEELWLGHEG